MWPTPPPSPAAKELEGAAGEKQIERHYLSSLVKYSNVALIRLKGAKCITYFTDNICIYCVDSEREVDFSSIIIVYVVPDAQYQCTFGLWVCVHYAGTPFNFPHPFPTDYLRAAVLGEGGAV